MSTTVAKRDLHPLTAYNDDIAEKICNRLADGESLAAICRTPGFPHKMTVHRWRAQCSEFAAAYARARELQAEHFVDELIEIADDGRNDYMQRMAKDGVVSIVVDHEHIARSKLRIHTRQWYAERVLQKQFGPNPRVVVNNNHLNQINLSELSDDDVGTRRAPRARTSCD